ncbi:P-loop containing nucleoside triphosphate hydrolase protein [Radiomyces spectabilis]|uniref:P-loop containing nucleoside triphosphate hydrolase protein n=1 Tax=Radiomyces spectabilis TaxID=64574 RepID=UPI002220DA5E|nr:P-loop containing nucleoside triphosphate hydrolase protein [Radiomyces spectabilis]KAI8365348.1 P-loop containing nucleoside triphosphate hydrolase protein [Radiomyces spectabilis]
MNRSIQWLHGGNGRLHNCMAIQFCSRSYAIMSRAKRQAGIPLEKPHDRSTPALRRTTRDADNNKQPRSGWRTTGPAREQIENNRPSHRSRPVDHGSMHKAPAVATAVNGNNVVKPASANEQSDSQETKATSEVDESKSVQRGIVKDSDSLLSILKPLKMVKPAGMKQRLVKVAKDVQQPENPHLLKVAVIGAANAGKSTLVNHLVGEDVSVVSSKAHTTRERILAVLSENNYQVIFLDTPGIIHNNNHARMNRTLATSWSRSLDEADFAIILVDGHWALDERSRPVEDYLLSQLKDLRIPSVLVFNKMDLLDYKHSALKEVTHRYRASYPFIKHALYISATTDHNMDKLKAKLFSFAQPKPWEFALDQKSDMSDLMRVEELIRVEFYKRLHHYIPYMLQQENVGWTKLRNGTLRIEQHVYVERDSQQKIVVGHKGAVINEVVAQAREQISKALKKHVQLFIQVKTKKR